MTTELTDTAQRLLDGPNFGIVATLGADGSPHSSVVWVDRDGDAVVFSITADKQKARNLARDPRISVTIIDAANPYRTVEIRGRAELIDDPEKELPERLSQKYLGQSPEAEPDSVRRLVVRIAPDKVNEFAV